VTHPSGIAEWAIPALTNETLCTNRSATGSPVSPMKASRVFDDFVEF